MDITAEDIRSLENMDAEDGGVGEGGDIDVVRVVDGGAGDAIVRGRGRGGEVNFYAEYIHVYYY